MVSMITNSCFDGSQSLPRVKEVGLKDVDGSKIRKSNPFFLLAACHSGRVDEMERQTVTTVKKQEASEEWDVVRQGE